MAPCADGGRCSWPSLAAMVRPGRPGDWAGKLVRPMRCRRSRARFVGSGASRRERASSRERWVSAAACHPPSSLVTSFFFLSPHTSGATGPELQGDAPVLPVQARMAEEPATSAWQRSTVALSSRRRPPPGAARERPRGPDRARSRLRAGWSSLHCPSRASERVTAWPEARRGNRPMMASASSACCSSASASSSWVEAADHHCGRTPRWVGGRRAVTGRRRRAGACPRLAGAQ